jgi:hypothetical protein
MNTCDTCKHWKKINDAHYCQCDSLIEGEMFADPMPEDAIVYLYYESAGELAFRPGPKFGCVHHEHITKTVRLWSGNKLVGEKEVSGWKDNGEHIKNIQKIIIDITSECQAITHAEVDGVKTAL